LPAKKHGDKSAFGVSTTFASELLEIVWESHEKDWRVSTLGADTHFIGVASSSSESLGSRSTWTNVFLTLKLPGLEPAWQSSRSSKLLTESNEVLPVLERMAMSLGKDGSVDSL